MPWFLCDKYQVNKTAPKPLGFLSHVNCYIVDYFCDLSYKDVHIEASYNVKWTKRNEVYNQQRRTISIDQKDSFGQNV
jgi:hypothetical protein